MKTGSSIFFAFCFQILHVIASAQFNNYVADIEVTDNGIKCVTPCGQDGLFEERYWCHTADAWDYCHLKYKDSEVTDNGFECVTPCGQDGLHEGRYWCHTSDTTDTWDYCNLQYKVETPVVKNFRNTRLRPRVSKTGIIDKIFNLLSRFSRKPRQHGPFRLIKKQDSAIPAPAIAVVIGGIVAAIAVAGLLNQTPASQPVPAVISSPSSSSNAVVPRSVANIPNQLGGVEIRPVPGRRRKRATFTSEQRKNLVTVLDNEFCKGLRAYQVIPSCGSRCNIQEEQIDIKVDGNFLEVTFVLVISTLTTTQAGIQAKLNRIHNSLSEKELMGFKFPPTRTSRGTYTDCIANPTWCQTCPGGDDFKNVGCPTSASVCKRFECTKDSHCRNGGTCKRLEGECSCKAGFVGSDCSMPRACGLDKTFLGGLCCDEGQVNTGLGDTDETGCADQCPSEIPENIDGVCNCGLEKVMYSKLDGTPLCCDEGQVQNEDKCADQCPNGMPSPVGGICSCGNDKTMFTKLDGSALCCDEGQVNDGDTCADKCSDKMPFLVGGTCGCALDKVRIANICCDEGQVKDGVNCVDSCSGGKEATDGVCGE